MERARPRVQPDNPAPLAIAKGAAPDLSGFPESLMAALWQAAQTQASIRYVMADGSEIVQSYGELWDRAARVAAGLGQQGQRPGDLVLLQLTSLRDLVTGFWGCLLGGYVPVPLTPHPTDPAISVTSALQVLGEVVLIGDRHIDTLSVPQFTLAQLQQADPLSSLPALPQPEEMALLLLTSGSTGTPKGVMLSHQNLRISAYGMASANGLSASDTLLNWMPLSHVASLVMFHLTPVFLGCDQIHVVNERVLREPLAWLDLIDRYRATATWAPNFAYGLVNDQVAALKDERQWDLSCLRWMGNGAEAVVSQTARRFLQLLKPHGLKDNVVSPGYGMSETCSGIVHSHRFSLETTGKDDTFVEVGDPIPGIAVRIVDEADQVVAEGIEGRLQVRGMTVMLGYYQRPDLNTEAFTDGWFDTGDLGVLRQGRLTITGRQKDIVIVNGVNIYCHEVEAAVEQLPEVVSSFTAACGVRRPGSDTEAIAVFFCPTSGLSKPLNLGLIRQIRTQVMRQIGIAPAYVIPVAQTAIPKTAIGKIQRRRLSEQFANGAFDEQLKQIEQAQRQQVGERPQGELEERIAQAWQTVLQIPVVGRKDNFFELGGTSLRLMQLLNELQTQGETLSATALFEYPTVASLASYLRQGNADLPRPRRRPQTQSDVAVIGMAGRFPGAANLDQFWQNLCDGVESITRFTDAEMQAAGIDPTLRRRSDYVNASPTLDGVELFDAPFFGYSPKEAELMDPQQRLMLECAWEALETAGYDPLTYGGDIALYAGASMNTYLLNHVYPQRHRLDPSDTLDPFTLSSMGGFQATVANDKDYLTTRVSYKLNLRGSSVNVQTACSTSLVAIHLAAQSLRQGECDLALAGGVSVETPQQAGYLYQEGMILSPDGHCRAFDAQAQGTLFGSGVGLVVLKSLAAAIADGDTIYAVIKGSAVGNDGGQKVGYLAPRSEGQATVAATALAMADVSAETVGYLEAHGTGTALGDPIEVAGLTQAFRLSTRSNQFCALGSVKTNVGHLNIASGVVGFIKAALALHHQKIPPSLHFTQPNPHIDFARSPFYVNTTLQDWPQGKTPRRAGVNSLGIGGTNVHVVLEEAPQRHKLQRYNDKAVRGAGSVSLGSEKSAGGASAQARILPIAAKSADVLRSLVQRYRDHLTQHPDLSLIDLCFTAAVGRSHFDHRAAFVAESVEQLKAKLQTWLDSSQTDLDLGTTTTAQPIAFLFTGQGSQSVGMARQLYDTQPAFRQALDRCADLLPEVPLLDLLYPHPSEAAEARLAQTAHTQPVLFAVEYALVQLWCSWGIRPAAVLGHSLGEYVAACVAGVFSLEDALHLVAARGRLMQALPAGGKMVAVQAEADAVAEVAKLYDVAIAAFNSPENTVLSGSTEPINQAVADLESQGVPCTPLRTSHAFHSPLMEPMLTEFRQVGEAVTYSPPVVDMISNVTGTLVDNRVATADYWVQHVRHPVKFAQGMETLHQLGYSTFVECGPRPVLLALAQATLPPQTWLPSLHPKQPDTQQILASLATLYQQGHSVDWSGLYPQPAHRIPLPTYPFKRQRYWLDRPTAPTPRPTDEHPLLGVATVTPFNHIFQQTLTQGLYLEGHQVQGQVLFPGAAFFELALAAGSAVLKTPDVRIRHVELKRSLSLAQPQILQTILTPDGEGYRFEIYSRPDVQPEASEAIRASHRLTNAPDPKWVRHSQGEIALAEPAQPAPLDLEVLKQACPEIWSAVEHYQRCQRLGLDYSGEFRGVQSVWRTEGQALAKIQIAEREVETRYHIYPALLDACFQAVLAALPETSSAPYVPVAVDCLRRYRPLTDAVLWSHVQLKSTGDVVTAEVQIADAKGNIVAFASGLVAKRVAMNPVREPWRDWLYRLVWKRSPLPSQEKTAEGSWLVIAHSAPLLEDITAQLATQGQVGRPILMSNIEAFEDIQQVLQQQLAAAPSNLCGIVYCATDLSGAKQESDPTAYASRCCHVALLLIQALIHRSPAAPPRLWFVTQGAQAVERDLQSPGQATLWGLGRAIAQEHPEFNTTCLDLKPISDETQLARCLVAELTRNNQDREVAYCQGQRYVAQLIQDPQIAPGKDTTLQLQAAARGTLESLSWQAVPRRLPEASEVEICVQATGLNFRDVLNVLDLYPGEAGPLGLECIGKVEAVGDGVTSLQVGDEVMAVALGAQPRTNTSAGFSQYVTLAADLVVPKPAALSDEEAATLPTAFLTAYYALYHLGQIQHSRKRVLIHAAAGGVGQAAVQLAQHAGAEVFATASPPKWDVLRQQGIRHVYNSRSFDFADAILEATEGKGVDVVLNSLSGEAIANSVLALAEGGCFLEIGKVGIWSANKMAQQRPDVAYKVIDLVAVTQSQPQMIQVMLQEIAEQVTAGNLQPLPIRIFTAAQTVEAFRYMQQAKHVGKVVITPPAQIRADAAYLITGGMGALGLRLAEWLVGRGARHLALLGRHAPSQAATETITRLEANGVEVQVLQADVAQRDELDRALSQVTDAPLRGIFHLAGQIDDGVLQQQSWSRFERVMAAKVRGTWHLHQLTLGLALDHFVLFSSAASLIGSAGQANYAAANAFLDAVAHLRRGQGLPALSLNWGAWAGNGLAASQTVRERLAHIQGQLIEPAMGLEILEHLLGTNVAQVGILPSQVQQADPALRASAESVSAQTALVAKVQTAAAGDRSELMLNYLRQQVAVVLGVAPGAIELHVGFTDLGLDSLTTVELRNRLQSDIGQPLAATLIYNYPTLTALTDYLLTMLAPEGSAPTRSDHAAIAEPPQSETQSEISVAELSETEAEALLLEQLEQLES